MAVLKTDSLDTRYSSVIAAYRGTGFYWAGTRLYALTVVNPPTVAIGSTGSSAAIAAANDCGNVEGLAATKVGF